ncbi:MAG: hypothetical protein A2268_08805 [Candidatus Raymondbacteria bacterium RifOxyA12_full_50_37]|uniref:STAS domain-containing protein n=1 Tax=Candidatus Raymondbacteria bacterium RIFOXYD12_FULL_49_13 TaxID=1817890 RepID=A0A1F7FGX0_UNCRA|nr:MAG: hypothetical protein A2350_19725 [Candidatus Raymondbacteria bacterium RifOxyB12_full_50_8]OGJ91592.1 MAG: hypothetical protein A2268_08805 [Candidatus Raymondbacteria bacterium RifOxyA12_full_50_37]OGJ92898.1 MAG: hypothetical protein A2248_08505 [Candidatus Raymondbacteria bacterium RIFOXYA2_FULL_49_16]OGJ94825.1 MAG: hypothetical protein A2487_03205 [Candidatus Raymondbacteria bacterium RifOxyC12_full_50_8]OGK05716.1 MAG: hypothetical protein A2519_03965 [Candidatus Raymondbacteria b
MSNLRIVEHKTGPAGNLIVLRIEGSIDQANIDQLQKTIARVVAGGCARIIANCEKLSFISSSGIGVFIDLKEVLGEKNGELAFAAVTSKFLNIFHKVGVDELFTMFPGEKEALSHFNQGA